MSEKIWNPGVTVLLEPLVRFERSEHFEEDVQRLFVGEVALRLDPSGESVEIVPGGGTIGVATGTELWLPFGTEISFVDTFRGKGLSMWLCDDTAETVYTGPTRIVVEYDLDDKAEPIRLAPGTLLGVLLVHGYARVSAAATDVFPGE